MLINHEMHSHTSLGKFLPDLSKGNVLQNFNILDFLIFNSFLQLFDSLFAVLIFAASNHFELKIDSQRFQVSIKLLPNIQLQKVSFLRSKLSKTDQNWFFLSNVVTPEFIDITRWVQDFAFSSKAPVTIAVIVGPA